MANVTLWSLPLGQPYFTVMTPPDAGRNLYFATQIGGVFGALDISTSRVRTWSVPIDFWLPATTPGRIDDIVERNGQVWISVGNRLVRVTPTAGLDAGFAAFMVKQYEPTTSPFPYVGPIAIDGQGHVWYGSAAHPVNPNAGSIGFLDPAHSRATFWDLPAPDLWSVSEIWPESDGQTVWFTLINPNTAMAGAYLARLDVTTGVLTYWSPTAANQPIGRGLIGDKPLHPTQMWFVSTGAAPSQYALYRLNVVTGAVEQFPATPPHTISPDQIVLDHGGQLWIGQDAPTISVLVQASGVAAPFASRTVTLTSRTISGDGMERGVTATTLAATKTTHGVTHASHGRFLDFAIPLAAGGIGWMEIDAASTAPDIWFSQSASQTIGVLVA